MKTVAATLVPEVVRSLRGLVVPEVREVGDVRRNAALFLARKAGDRRSSFERNLRPSLDSARLSEVPYLASVGYLIAARVLASPPIERLRAALENAVRRAPHTAERTGYADDALCACGLLLLAEAVGAESSADGLRKTLAATTAPDAAVGALLSVVTAAQIRFSCDLDATAADQLASAALVHRIDDALARRLFPGFPLDLEGQLLALLSRQTYSPAGDFASMLILAALESSVTMPEEEPPAVDGTCDIGIVIALTEEFRVLFDRFESRHTHVEDGGRSYYIFDVTTLAGERPYRCVATLVGGMGTNRTSVVAEKMLQRWAPAVTVVVGIAGGIHKDVRLGDVVVASEVSNYIEGAKVVDGVAGVSFQRTGDSFKTRHALLERVRNFEFANRASFLKWQAACESRCRLLDARVEQLRDQDLLRPKPAQLEGHVASGPLVVTSSTFITWIRDGDRACFCVEMESGGAMIAGHMDPSRRDVLVIRSVSDFADDRKSALDLIGGGVLRGYAMENAVDFLWSLMEAGALPRGPEVLTPPTKTLARETIEEALLRVLREHADENREVTATWSQISEWLGGIPGDLHAAALRLKHDGHFRSQTFEFGSDGICSIALRG